MRKLLCLLMFGYFFSLSAAERRELLSAKSQWCVGNVFKVVIGPSEANGYDLDSSSDCVTLNVAHLFSPQLIELNRSFNRPIGNVFLFILQHVYGWDDPNIKNFRQSEEADYVVKQGNCGSSKFFIVEQKRINDTNDLDINRHECTIDETKKIRSTLILEGVYSRESNQSMDSFISSLLNQ